MTATTLPSYNQAIKDFIPPPTYQDVIDLTNIILLPNAFAHTDYYSTDAIHLMDVDEVVDVYDEDIIEYFNSNSNSTPYSCYEPISDKEINDLKMSLKLTVDDKLVQIKRNISFVEKKIKSNELRYYIDGLRVSTIKDFKRIEQKIMNESLLIDELMSQYSNFNRIYSNTIDEISKIKTELKTFLGTCTNSNQTSTNVSSLYQLNNKLNKCYHNLKLIINQIAKFTNTDDISYILKERARVYNEAKQVIINRQRL